jgi:uncharacterized protein (DUF305 family)
MRQMVAGLRWATLILVGSAVVAACQPGEDSATTDTGAAGDTGALGGTGAGGNTTADASTLGTVMAVHASEVQMGELAQEKATNAQVRQFAQRIEQEHQQFLDRGRQLSPQPDTAQADRQLVQMADSTMRRLRNMARGAAFDTAFVNAQVAAHEAALQRLGGQTGGQAGDTAGAAGRTGGDTGSAAGAGGSQNPSEWVNASRAAVQAHLQQARQLQQQLGGGQR